MTETAMSEAEPLRGLIVYVPGLYEKATSSGKLLDRLLAEPELAGYERFVYRPPLTVWSRGGLAVRGHELMAAITGFWVASGRPPAVILMGHSIGGLLVRYAYLDAGGGFGRDRQDWYPLVQRIVLFAAPNRGLDPKRLPFIERAVVSTALSVPALTRRFTGLDAIHGAPFLTNLRVQWIRQMHDHDNPPLVVQVLGTADTNVHPDDSRDVESLPTSAFVEIPYGTHANIIQPDSPAEDRPGEQYLLLRSAVIGTPSPQPGVTQAPGVRAGVNAVVFLLHGIRADTYGWVQDIAERLASNFPEIEVQRPSYGYMPAFNFALPFGHDRQLRQFADWYTERRSQYPHAAFHFVGHSNGTYILGRSLDRVPAMSFDRVWLAGSVLPQNYDWTQRGGQVGYLVNTCGSDDKPVAWLCSALRGLGRRDLGTGGFNGFDNAPSSVQFVHLDGGHDAGLRDDRRAKVVDYLTGSLPLAFGELAGTPWQKTEANPWFARASRLAPIAAPVGAAAIITGLGLAAMSGPVVFAGSAAAAGLVLVVLKVA